VNKIDSVDGVKTFFRRNILVRIAAAIVLLSLGACRNGDREDITLPTPLPEGGTVVSYAEVINRVAAAVVTIRSERRVRAPRQHPFFDDPFFREFFGQIPSVPREQIQRGQGSGVILTADGYIVTNHHVVDGAEEIKVELTNNRLYDAKIVGADPRSDLAVLKINANDLPPLTLGDSDRVRVGDVVLAIGNPLGVGQTVTAGIISAKGRRTGLSDGSFESFLQTDAPINQGNSGGALVNTTGEVVGINSQILTPTGGNIGIGFAIPGRFGMTVAPITPDLAARLGLRRDTQGLVVTELDPAGPAADAGMQPGDVIQQANRQPVRSPDDLKAALDRAGDRPVLVLVNRGGNNLFLSLRPRK
jgi:S1-C subfamily serine protease